MKILSSFSFQHKVILVLVLFLNLPFFVTGYMAKSLTETMVLREKEDKLLALAAALECRLGPGGYEELLREHGAENAPREEIIRVLNQALAPATEEVSRTSSGLGIGFYCREADAIVTYGPAAQFGQAVGRPIPPDHPGRIVMETNTPLVRSGTMVRGDIMNAMVPVERGGKVIGYVWANELTTDISEQVSELARNIFAVMALCFVLTVGCLFLLSRRTVRDMDRIVKGVRELRHDLNTRIASSGGELAEVVENINTMAADLAKANEETSRAIAVFQIVLNNVDAIVYVCDPETKTLVYVNDSLCKVLNRDDLQGKRCHEALHGLAAACPFCPQRDLFHQGGRPTFQPLRSEFHNVTIERDFLVTDRLVTWHDGRILHMRVGTDITERNALAMAEAANLAQREFLARMSHEIRTPMNGVLGMTRLAIQADPPPAQREYLKKIQASASLLLGIINDILDFSRIEAGKLTIEKHSFNLHEMVENIRELILPRIDEQGLEFRLDMDPSVPEYAYGDGLRLSQVLLNLLGNASKFTLQGFVSLSMRPEPLDSDALRLHCEVRDSGIGMSEEEQQGLFKPFSQADSSTSRRFGGTGLGLSICKALVDLMGGRIQASSTPGAGSVFSFFVELERVEDPQNVREERPNAWENARYDGLCFLLVEDNDINQEIAVAILAEMGVETDVASNGEEGVRAFLRKDYALILMDVRMPIMDGLEATRRIRTSGKHDAATVPIIAMTANAMLEDRIASKEAGMNGHIAKPIDVNELKSALFRILKGKSASKE